MADTDTDAPQLEALGAHLAAPEAIPFVRVALCRACGVRHPWTPERGWGCPRAVAPQDTVGGLAERLREAQTVAFFEARRRRHAERLARASAAELARVTAELDALLGALEVELERACDTTTRYTPERVLATTGGER